MLDTHRWHISPQVPQNWQVGIIGDYRGLSVRLSRKETSLFSVGSIVAKEVNCYFSYADAQAKRRFFYGLRWLQSSHFECTFLSTIYKTFAPHFVCKHFFLSPTYVPHFICALFSFNIIQFPVLCQLLFQRECNHFEVVDSYGTPSCAFLQPESHCVLE